MEGSNANPYMQNLNDLLQNTIMEQMQVLIKQKKELQQKIKDQNLVYSQLEQNIDSLEQTQQMITYEVNQSIQKQVQLHQIVQDIEEEIQRIIEKQQEKDQEYQ